VKLALGTAQIGLPYGVANTRGQVSPAEAFDMLALAKTSGIDTLDTAIAYGNSESRLGEIGVGGFKVISKLPPLPLAVALPPGGISEWANEQVIASLVRLRISKLSGLLLHQPGDLMAHADAYLAALLQLKRDGLVDALGVSVYSPDELGPIFDVLQPDIVQAPLNVFDQRLIRSGWLGKMAANGVRVHVRSALLQGALTMRERRPAWFGPWHTLFDRWFSYCRALRESPTQVAMGFALAQPLVERVVAGVDSLAQLRELVSLSPVERTIDEFACDDLDLIDPTRWKVR
jgi:aryl-alcohol dehydrogenase-like predicted oxidoreductase